jgi:hypothetical protein
MAAKDTDVYKQTVALLKVIIEVHRNLPRDLKPVLGTEVHRQAVAAAAADGVVLHVTGTLSGANVPGHSLREIAIIDSDGDLAGRRAFRPLELEPGTEIETTLTLQF